jgi:tRNA-specific 2-thiouridylase
VCARVLVAMSGGVDSSVAAALLVRKGYDVVGATMKLFCHGDEVPDRPCCSLDSVNDARRVCERIGIPHYVLNLQTRFGEDVIDDFVREYEAGRTPIPCVRCNTFTKFRDLLHKADAVDADFIATGHYARVADGVLYRGADPGKDQTYFLWGIDRGVLERLQLPVGGLTKAETRRVAHSLGLEVVADKVESQDICFVPDGDHTGVIARRLGPEARSLAAGPIVDARGRVLGEHCGYARYTVGQRRGLPGGFGEPMYVVAIRPESRTVVIGPREALLGHGVIATGVNWLVEPVDAGHRVQVRVRHRAPAAPAEIVRSEPGAVELALDEPVAAITPGQSLVMYDGDRVLGGGLIASAAGARGPLPILAA